MRHEAMIDAEVFANDGSVLPKPERDAKGKVIKVTKVLIGDQCNGVSLVRKGDHLELIED